MTSQYIPKQKQVVKESLLTRLANKIPRSFYVGKVKVSVDSYPVKWTFGMTVYPQYKQLEFNFGLYHINFWYRP